MSATASASSDAVACVVNETYFPHFFLIPAGAIIIILAFLRRRRSFKKDVWGGRPGLVIPIDFLGIDHDRLGIVCVFGAATGSVMNLITQSVSGRNPWETAFLTIGIAVEVAFLYYPYFACLASYHRIIGAMMGLPYVTVFFIVNIMDEFQKCKDNNTWSDYVAKVLPSMPTILCHLFIMGKFVIVLYKEFRDLGTCAVNIFSRQVEQSSAHEVKLVRPWLRNHVKDLIKSRPSPVYKGIMFILRKIYNPEKNFKFSTQTLSVVMICVILLYSVSILILFLASYLLEKIREADRHEDLVDLMRGLFGCLIAATILAVIFCVVSLIRFMENHKNNMLRMFKGDKSFIPKTVNVSQFMIGKGLRYHSYQIGYFLWGYILLLMLFWIICFFFYSLSFPIVQDKIVSYIKGGGVVAGVAVVTGLSLPLASFTIFRDYSYSKDVISIDNRNVYLVFSYFWFFIGLPMGFFSAISRILKAMAVGAVMLPRIDHSVMPDGFQQIDQGFVAYVCYLHVQTAFRNPVLRVFCQTLCDEIRDNTRQKWAYSPQARNKWFLAVTLIRNPQLASERKPDMQADIPEQAGCSKCEDVKIEVCQYGADNSRLVQDK